MLLQAEQASHGSSILDEDGGVLQRQTVQVYCWLLLL